MLNNLLFIGRLETLRGQLLYFHMFDDMITHEKYGDVFKVFDNGTMLMVDESPWFIKHNMVPHLYFTDMSFAYYYRRFYSGIKVFT